MSKSKEIRKNRVVLIVSAIICTTVILSSCKLNLGSNNHTLWQNSTLSALMQGNYDGNVEISEMLKHGDTGLGTVDKLDGEMIVLDGKAYQAKYDGAITKVAGDVTTPFACVTKFDSCISYDDSNVTGVGNMVDLTNFLNKSTTEKMDDPNLFYMVKIKGNFNSVLVRSVPAQEKPYQDLSEITKTQSQFSYKNIDGTLVALYCPSYMSGINLAGWHVHFISDDEQKGGHVLDADIGSAQIETDVMDKYQLLIPTTAEFAHLNLKDLSEKDKKAEEKSKD